MRSVNVYSKAAEGNRKVSEHFRVREFACSDGADAVFIDPALVGVLQAIRTHFGAAVTVNSAYRTPAKNKAVGGAGRSQHLYGTAADITVRGVSPQRVADFAETLLEHTGGIGRYAAFTHIDLRDEKARWKG